ncbi:unnamed protein product [Lathyrus oleraceus]
MTMWLACHGRSATKQRLFRFAIIFYNRCCFRAHEEEYNNYMMFLCPKTVSIWTKILEWIQIKHNPQLWDEELKWLSKSTKDKGWRSSTLKLAATETFNGVWKYSNDICYGNVVDKTKIMDNIIDINVY